MKVKGLNITCYKCGTQTAVTTIDDDCLRQRCYDAMDADFDENEFEAMLEKAREAKLNEPSI